MSIIGLSGGEALRKKLEELRKSIGAGEALRVGFLEGSSYPDGTPVAQIAAIQEFGATIQVQAHDVEIHRSLAADGSFNKNGKFVKKKKANFSTTHAVPAHSITIPPRPFFRQMIAANSPKWGSAMAKVMKASDYSGAKSLAVMGELLQGQLQQSIRDFSGAPLAQSTIAAKGSAKQLVDTGNMLNSVASEVTTE